MTAQSDRLGRGDGGRAAAPSARRAGAVGTGGQPAGAADAVRGDPGSGRGPVRVGSAAGRWAPRWRCGWPARRAVRRRGDLRRAGARAGRHGADAGSAGTTGCTGCASGSSCGCSSRVTVAELAEAVAGDLGADGRGGRARAARRAAGPAPAARPRRCSSRRPAGPGCTRWLRGDTLRLVTLAGAGDPVKLHYGQSLWEARVEANLDRVAGGYTALGWHPQRAEPIEEQATSPRSGRQVVAAPGAGRRRRGRRPGRWSTSPVAAPTSCPRRPRRRWIAAAARRGRLRGRRRTGTPGCGPAGCVDVSGLAEEVDGRYVLTEAVHTVDGAGWSTRAVHRAAGTGGRRRRRHLDHARQGDRRGRPGQLGRVRVSLPGYGDPDAGWLGVLCPGAGSGRGIVALPDVEDTVLVALPHGVPAAGVVLGSLYGTIEPPDPGVDGGVGAPVVACAPRTASRSWWTTTSTRSAWRTRPAASWS